MKQTRIQTHIQTEDNCKLRKFDDDDVQNESVSMKTDCDTVYDSRLYKVENDTVCDHWLSFGNRLIG